MFKAVTGVRPLSDGRLLVNDGSSRRIVALDSALSHPSVLIDSAAGHDNSYGTGSGGLIPYAGDSTLFVDRAAQAFVVIDPAGRIARVTPLPGRNSILYLTAAAGQYGVPTAATAFGVVFESPQSATPPAHPGPGEPDLHVVQGDTTYVIGYNLIRHTTDTLGRLSTGRGISMRVSATDITQELPNRGALLFRTSDGWAVTTDGSLALVRGRDYHIDWTGPNGSRTASPRIAHDWQHYTDDDKARFADSVNRTVAVSDSITLAGFLRDSLTLAGPKGDSIRTARTQTLLANMSASGAPPGVLEGIMKSSKEVAQRPAPAARMAATDIPEYRPAIAPTPGNFRGDADNNVWIRTAAGPFNSQSPVWDVVNRQGVLVDRIQIPANRTIVGFAPGGIVYLSARDGGNALVERVRWK
jgi:hypothetical protein